MCTKKDVYEIISDEIKRVESRISSLKSKNRNEKFDKDIDEILSIFEIRVHEAHHVLDGWAEK